MIQAAIQFDRTIAAMNLHALQDQAVADYLEANGEIERDFAYRPISKNSSLET